MVKRWRTLVLDIKSRLVESGGTAHVVGGTCAHCYILLDALQIELSKSYFGLLASSLLLARRLCPGTSYTSPALE